jgi:hypothetical protein
MKKFLESIFPCLCILLFCGLFIGAFYACGGGHHLGGGWHFAGWHWHFFRR